MPEARSDHERVASQIFRALAEQRHGEAADLAEANWPVLVTHQLPVLRAVADQLTPAELAARPGWDRIRHYLGYLMLDGALRPAAYIEASAPYPPKSLGDTLLTLSTRCIAARTAGRLSEAVQLARAALERLAEARESELDPIRHRLADGHLHWGLSFEFAGLEAESLANFERAHDLGVAFGNARVAADAAGELAWLHALAGRGRIADEWIERARTLAASSRSSNTWRRSEIIAIALRAADHMRPDDALDALAARPADGIDEHRLTVLGQSVIFRLSAGRASPTVLLSELRRAETANAPLLAERGENLIVLRYIEALVHLSANHPDRAIELLSGISGGGGAPYAIGMRATAHLAVGARAEARRDAETVIARYGQWPRQSIPALLVKAVLALGDGDTDAAASAFTDACELALGNGVIASLLVIPHADFARLVELAGDRLSSPQVAELSRTPLLFAPAPREAVNLSPRELGVLRELAAGGTLAEVAARLYVSVNTLKVHNQAIYRKLGVERRAQAVATALGRGLI